MNRLIFLLLIIAQTAHADLVGRVNDCYTRFLDVKEASRCADLKLALALNNLKPGNGDRPTDPSDSVFEIFYCTNHGDPQFKKTIVSTRGEVLRDDIIEIITNGGDEDEIKSCLRKLKSAPHKIPRHQKVRCSCTNHGDPILKLELIDRNYQTVKNINLFTFTLGGDQDEQRDCKQTIQALSFCHSF